MQRRSFLKLIAVTALAPALPEPSCFQWRCDYRPDYYCDQLYCCYTAPDGKKYHIAYLIQPGSNRRPAIEAMKTALKRMQRRAA